MGVVRATTLGSWSMADARPVISRAGVANRVPIASTTDGALTPSSGEEHRAQVGGLDLGQTKGLCQRVEAALDEGSRQLLQLGAHEAHPGLADPDVDRGLGRQGGLRLLARASQGPGVDRLVGIDASANVGDDKVVDGSTGARSVAPNDSETSGCRRQGPDGGDTQGPSDVERGHDVAHGDLAAIQSLSDTHRSTARPPHRKSVSRAPLDPPTTVGGQVVGVDDGQEAGTTVLRCDEGHGVLELACDHLCCRHTNVPDDQRHGVIDPGQEPADHRSSSRSAQPPDPRPVCGAADQRGHPAVRVEHPCRGGRCAVRGHGHHADMGVPEVNDDLDILSAMHVNSPEQIPRVRYRPPEPPPS